MLSIPKRSAEKPVLAWEREARHKKKHLKALWRVSKRGFSWGFNFGDIWQAFVNLMGVATEERKEQDTLKQLKNIPIMSSGLRPRCARSRPRYVA